MPLNDRDRRALKIGGIIAAVLVVALLGIGQLGKGGGEALPPLSIGPTASSGPTGIPTTAPSGSTATPSASGGPSPSPIFSGRDPFSLPPQFVSASATASGSTETPPTSAPPTSPGGSPGGGGGSPSSSPSNGASTVVGGHTVVLIDTFTQNGVQKATVSVDGTVYHPAEGDTFAGGQFQLRDVAGNCATFLYGDESFTLCFVPSK